MRVILGVDAIEPQLSGIGRYTLELARRLPAHPGIDQLRFFGRRRLIDDPERLFRGEAVFRGKGPKRWLRAVQAQNAFRSSLVHGPNFFLPQGAGRGVITIHDLSVLRYPGTHPAERVTAFARELTTSLSRAEHVITDTETIRQEVIKEFAIDSSRVTAVPLGVDTAFRPRSADGVKAVLAGFGLTRRSYGLCVATLEPRKKISELIDAWSALPASLRSSVPLVIAGGKGWQNDALHDRIAAAEAAGWLRHLGYVEEDKLPSLYAGAALFLYPSTYEGFGLPPLEAMASGTPVMVADRSCLPEVCGRAARYIDPDNQGAFRDAIEVALADQAWRTAAAQLGPRHAAQFTWDRCVDETVAVYEKAWNRR